MSAPDLFDFLGTDVSVFGAEVHHHWTARRLRGICSDLSAVIAHSRRRIEARSRQPRKTSAIAKSQHANFQLAPFRSRMADRSRHVQQSRVQADLSGCFHSLRHTSRVIAKLKVGLHAIKQCRSDNVKALG